MLHFKHLGCAEAHKHCAASKWHCEGERMKSRGGSFPFSAGDQMFYCRTDSLGNNLAEHGVI